ERSPQAPRETPETRASRSLGRSAGMTPRAPETHRAPPGRRFARPPLRRAGTPPTRSSTFSLPKRPSSTQADDLATVPGMFGLHQQKPGHRGAGDGAAALGQRACGDAVARGAVVGEEVRPGDGPVEIGGADLRLHSTGIPNQALHEPPHGVN